ncbi:MAG: aminotransferase class IV family protein [Chitinophagales bacterium]|nr:aminotransferase class IV family protein [Chitinophagales bacterium]
MAVFFNDHFVANENALLHVSDLSIQRGYAVFDFCRTKNRRPLFLNDHLDRFYASAAAMHLPARYHKEELAAIIYELIERTLLDEAGIRILLTGGYSADGYQPASPNLIITCNAVKTASLADFENGVTAMTYEQQRELPSVKTINYMMAVWLQPLLKEKKVNDVLYHHKGIITEFPRSNVFIVTKDQRLLTPSRHMLRGITRKQVLSLAAKQMDVEERDIRTEELLQAAEVFLTSTTKKIMPVAAIDGNIIGDGKPGAITRKLYNAFLQLEQQQSNQ